MQTTPRTFVRRAAFSASALLLLAAACSQEPAPADAAPDAPATPVDAPVLPVDAPSPIDAPPPACAPTTRPTGVVTVAGAIGGTASPIAVDAFCDAVADAACSVAPACGCTTDPGCPAAARAACDSGEGPLAPATRAALLTGDVSYDPVAAGHVIAAIRDAAADCPRQPVAIFLSDLVAATGALHGARPDGTLCESGEPFSCVAGSLCSNVGDLTYACAPSRTGGDGGCRAFGRCDAAGGASTLACEGQDCDLGDPPGAVCRFGGRCVTSSCVGDYCTCEAGPGDACITPAQCATGVCEDGVCAPAPIRLGAPCTTGCTEGTCSSAGVCVAWQCAPFGWVH